jgi:enamine deaminase RidA (YjgF/YER057c/UK114 family)
MTTIEQTSSSTTAINPWTWSQDHGFAQGVVSRDGSTLSLAGQASVDADGAPVHAGDMEAQLRQALDNVDAVLAAAGFERADVVRVNLFVTDIGAYFPASGAFHERFAAAGIAVAATLLNVSALAYPELMVEVEATAIR